MAEEGRRYAWMRSVARSYFMLPFELSSNDVDIDCLDVVALVGDATVHAQIDAIFERRAHAVTLLQDDATFKWLRAAAHKLNDAFDKIKTVPVPFAMTELMNTPEMNEFFIAYGMATEAHRRVCEKRTHWHDTLTRGHAMLTAIMVRRDCRAQRDYVIRNLDQDLFLGDADRGSDEVYVRVHTPASMQHDLMPDDETSACAVVATRIENGIGADDDKDDADHADLNAVPRRYFSRHEPTSAPGFGARRKPKLKVETKADTTAKTRSKPHVVTDTYLFWTDSEGGSDVHDPYLPPAHRDVYADPIYDDHGFSEIHRHLLLYGGGALSHSSKIRHETVSMTTPPHREDDDEPEQDQINDQDECSPPAFVGPAVFEVSYAHEPDSAVF